MMTIPQQCVGSNFLNSFDYEVAVDKPTSNSAQTYIENKQL